jgi:CrcB protein
MAKENVIISAEDLATLPRGVKYSNDQFSDDQNDEIRALENELAKEARRTIPRPVSTPLDGAGQNQVGSLTITNDPTDESILNAFEDRVVASEALDNFGLVPEKHVASLITMERVYTDRTVILEQNQFVMHAALAIGSYAGVLIRIYTNQWMSYVGAPVYSLMYPNFIGCIIMGYVAASREWMFETYYPLFLGLGTGLCGSITTFSSWSLLVVRSLADSGTGIQDGVIYQINAALAYLIIGLATSFGGLYMGNHLHSIPFLNSRKALKRRGCVFVKSKTTYQFTPTGWSLQSWNWQDYLVVSFSILCFLSCLLPIILSEASRKITFSMLFAPLGTWIRWRLSVLNVKNAHFPYGTFAANVVGTVLLCGIYFAEMTVLTSSVTPILCPILYGLANGFCGCLTTISTFILEMSTMKTKDMYVYGSTSILVADVLGFLTCGVYFLVVGYPNGGVCGA